MGRNNSDFNYEQEQARQHAETTAREDRAYERAKQASEHHDSGDHTWGDYSYPDEPERPQS